MNFKLIIRYLLVKQKKHHRETPRTRSIINTPNENKRLLNFTGLGINPS